MHINTCLSAIEGNALHLDGGAMFGNAPRALWEKWHKPDHLGRIRLATRALLIERKESDRQVKILCETGVGNFFPPKLATRYGVEDSDRNMLLSSLQARGIRPEEIDYVFISHLHFDHTGGLLTREGELNFPHARYVVGRDAYERAEKPTQRDHASFIPGLTQKLKASGRLQIIDENTFAEIPGLELLYTDGHTIGQMHVLYSGKNEKIFFCGDLIPGLAWLHLPITTGYDRFPEKLIEEKKHLYSRALKEQWLLFFMHDPKILMVNLQEEEGKYKAERIYDTLDSYLMA